jgi:hypothetical protein
VKEKAPDISGVFLLLIINRHCEELKVDEELLNTARQLKPSNQNLRAMIPHVARQLQQLWMLDQSP